MLANFTVIGSVAPLGFWPFSPLMASSASILLSNRMNPTPLDTPRERERAFVKSEQTKLVNTPGKRWAGPQRDSVGSQPTGGARAEPGSLYLSHPSKPICLCFCHHGSGQVTPTYRTQAPLTFIPASTTGLLSPCLPLVAVAHHSLSSF